MTKGNDGTAARRRTMKKIALAAGIALGVTFVIVWGSTPSRPHRHKRQFEDDRYQFDRRDPQRRLPEGRRTDYDMDRFRTDYDMDRFGRGGHHPVDFEMHKKRVHEHNGPNRNGFYGEGHDDRDSQQESGSRWKLGWDWGGRQEIDDAYVNAGDDPIAKQYRRDLLQGHRNVRAAKEALEGILNGSVNLVDLSRGLTMAPSPDGSYNDIKGKFCKLNFSLHKKDPTSVPMFRFIVHASPDCDRNNAFVFDLKKVTYLARKRDEQVDKNSGVGPKVLNITNVVFHESRCGSTLLANSMIAMNPTKHRSYSESAPMIKAFHACGPQFDRCSEEQVISILKDTAYLMSRTDDHREERVFFKFQSSLSTKIRTFQKAFPDIPWLYSYREPVQVMMSHIKDDPAMRYNNCVKSRRFPPLELEALSRRLGRDGSSDLKPYEYCAAHLAQLTESAANSLNDMAIPVAYHQLPDMLWTDVFPRIFGRPLEQFEIDNLRTISKSYSKAGSRVNKKGEYKDDTEQKEKMASEEVRQAAKDFLKDSFDRLLAFEPPLLK